MMLYRPVGLEELRLVYESEMRAFPPRLPDQPIFYPVTNEEYATQIARDWNTKSGTKGGFVTRFAVDDSYASKFERRVVGAREHEELWVPAEELAEFNSKIEGQIEIVGAHFGEGYRGHVPDAGELGGMDARAQLLALARTLPDGGFDLVCELNTNHAAVFLNFLFWEQADFRAAGVDNSTRRDLLGNLKKAWDGRDQRIAPLGLTATTTTATSST